MKGRNQNSSHGRDGRSYFEFVTFIDPDDDRLERR